MAAILIVEDDPDILTVLGRMLPRIAGLACRSVGDVPSALAVLETEAIALVLTDVNLPGMSGLELATRIQARWPAIPIVLISGGNPLWLAQIAQQHRVAGVLAKPFRMDELRAVVLPLLP